MKLHLGCGERFLEGYVNIDYAQGEHAVQRERAADVLADLTTLSYEPDTIDEIRMHHVFEHFPRAQACALLTNWHQWLKPSGTLRIEVPDFERTFHYATRPFRDGRVLAVALRHLFGSQEAEWALHFDGFTEKTLSRLLERFGFRVEEIRHNAWQATYNIEAITRKHSIMDRQQLARAAAEHLRQYLVDDSDSEQRLFAVWMEQYRQHVVPGR